MTLPHCEGFDEAAVARIARTIYDERDRGKLSTMGGAMDIVAAILAAAFPETGAACPTCNVPGRNRGPSRDYNPETEAPPPLCSNPYHDAFMPMLNAEFDKLDTLRRVTEERDELKRQLRALREPRPSCASAPDGGSVEEAVDNLIYAADRSDLADGDYCDGLDIARGRVNAAIAADKQRAVEKAVEKERERCAKVAESVDGFSDPKMTRTYIAAAIRGSR